MLFSGIQAVVQFNTLGLNETVICQAFKFATLLRDRLMVNGWPSSETFSRGVKVRIAVEEGEVNVAIPIFRAINNITKAMAARRNFFLMIFSPNKTFHPFKIKKRGIRAFSTVV
jgi:hypothetical protein